MSKFKEGDKVVVLNTPFGKIAKAVGSTGTVSYIEDKYVATHEHGTAFQEEELELESVYNSPLYKALR